MKRADATSALLLAVFVGLGVAGEPRMATTYDEPQHLRWGRAALSGRFAREGFYDDSKMPVTALNAAVARALQRLTPDPSSRLPLHGARLVTLAFSAAVALLLYRFTLALYGEAGALLCLTLYVLEPNLIAHSQLVTTDVFAMGAAFATVYSFRRFLGAPGWRTALASAAALGLAQLAKYTCVLLFPVLLLTALAHRALARASAPAPGGSGKDPAPAGRSGWRRAVLWTALHLVVPLLIVDAGFGLEGVGRPLDGYRFRSSPFRAAQVASPLVSSLPLPVAAPWLEGLDWVLARSHRSEGAFANLYLLGRTIPTDVDFRGFKGYYLVAYAFKVPLATQLLVLAGLGAWVAALRRRERGREAAFLLVPAAFFWVYFNLFHDAQIGIRHFLLVQPFMIALAGALPGVFRAGRSRRMACAGLAVLVLWQAASVLSYHPHYLPYFNELVPDKRYAYRVLADSNLDWGQSRHDVRKYLEDHPAAVLNPPRPTAGRLVVGVNELTGVAGGAERFRWLRERFRPVEHVAYTHLVYDVSHEALGEALGQR